jgi:hypothetical protein
MGRILDFDTPPLLGVLYRDVTARRSRRGAIPTTFLGGSPALPTIQLIALPISGIACGRGLIQADSRGWQE